MRPRSPITPSLLVMMNATIIVARWAVVDAFAPSSSTRSTPRGGRGRDSMTCPPGFRTTGGGRNDDATVVARDDYDADDDGRRAMTMMTMMMIARLVDLDVDPDVVDGAAEDDDVDSTTPDIIPSRRGGEEDRRRQPSVGGGIDDDDDDDDVILPTPPPPGKRRMELSWCNHDSCYEAIREKVVGDHNHVELTGPATGQVVYTWETRTATSSVVDAAVVVAASSSPPSPPAVLMLVKRDDDELIAAAAQAIKRLMDAGVQVLVDSTLMEELANYDGVDLESSMIRLFYPRPVPGFGSGDQLFDSVTCGSISDDDDDGGGGGGGGDADADDGGGQLLLPADLSDADLVVTLGGDGLLMYAAQVFSGPVPPILPVAGGSMGFLTPFSREEMLEAILVSLGLREAEEEVDEDDDGDDLEKEEDDEYPAGSSAINDGLKISQRANNHMLIEATTREGYNERPPLAFGNNNKICISMRMRLDCRIFGSDGSLLSRYAVLNEVVIDRGSSPYLASLECFCDDVHLTTVQADGIIFSTPTGSTAYSMAAGGSVVHPAVPAILVTPICPHVLSFRSMIFPDHVVLRCYVPSDARSTACVYFDGKHRTELNRGDSVQIQMSAHPVPTINRADHSSDWLGSLKRNFNFNTRVRQNPL